MLFCPFYCKLKRYYNIERLRKYFMHTKKHVISGVKPDSIAMELELEPGDELISINGKE